MLLSLCVVVAMATLSSTVDGYSTGAPGAGDCMTLQPSHGASPQTSASPYTITFSSPTFTAGGAPVSVTLSGGTFKGFLLTTQYADAANDQSLKPGALAAVTDTRLLCSNGAVTHVNPNPKTTLTFQWTPPSTSLGHIKFRATIVQSRTVYWVDITKELYDAASPSASPSAGPSATTPSAATGNIVKDSACGTTKGCFSDCSGSSCKYLMTWEAVPGNTTQVLITLKGRVGSDNSRYIAFGLSTDSRMDSDSVNYCFNNPNGVYASWNDAGRKSNTVLQDAHSGIFIINVAVTDGILTCTFQRSKAATTDAKGQRFALDTAYTIFWATGTGASAFGISEHDQSPGVSARSAALTDFTVDIFARAKSPLVMAHGSLMMIAWLLAASIGIVFARFFKDVWPDKKLFDQKIWFQVHRASMILVFCVTAIAFIIIFVEADGYSEVGEEGYKKAHPVLGIIVMALTVINPIMSLFRCAPGTAHRPIFNWAHWSVGTGAYILGIITIFFGFTLDKSGAPRFAIYVMAAYVVWQCCFQLAIEFMQFKAKSIVRQKDFEMSQQAKDGKDIVQKPSTFYKVVMGGIHIVVVTVFVIALIVILCAGEDDD